MKKLLLSVICVIAVLTQANAQDKTFNFGLKMAPAISWLSIGEPGMEPNGARMKFNWGFIGAWNFSDNFSLVSGFNINSLGGNYKYSTDVVTLPTELFPKNRIKYSEFQLPAIFQMRTNPIGDMRLHLQIGLAEGIMLSARDIDDNKINNSVRNFNTAYIVAGGMEYQVLGELNLLAQLKYNGGITKITKRGDVRNNFLELALGVIF